MINQQELTGNWNQIKGRIREKWSSISNDDLAGVKGDVDRLVGRIQEKTGESREKIESFLDRTLESGSAGISEAAEHIRTYAEDLSHATQEQLANAQDAMANGLKTATDTVRRRPAESAAVCFGVGLIAGAALSLILKNRS
ncbi:MAG: hypothetical protein Fues2KO_37230 [Fuerstiella sp.]